MIRVNCFSCATFPILYIFLRNCGRNYGAALMLQSVNAKLAVPIIRYERVIFVRDIAKRKQLADKRRC